MDIHSRLDSQQQTLDELHRAEQSDSVRNNDQVADHPYARSVSRHSRHHPAPYTAPPPQPLQLPDPSTLGKLSDEVIERVARRVKQLPLLDPYTTDDTSLEEEETAPVHKQKLLKSGKVRTADTQAP